MTTATKASKAVLETRKRPKLDVKDAVAIAMKAFCEFYPDLNYSNLALEEVEEDDEGFWLITLGYDFKRKPSGPLQMLQSENLRAFKVFRINNATGRVASMKIRTVD